MRRCLHIILLLFIIGLPLKVYGADAVADIKAQIEQRQQKLADLKKQIEQYQNSIAEKQQKASSLKKELSVLDDKINRAKLDLESNQLKLSTVSLQINAVNLEIVAKDRQITSKKQEVAEALRQIHQYDQQSTLQILLLNKNLSQFFEQLNYLQTIQRNLQEGINEVQTLKTELGNRQSDLASYRAQLIKTKEDIEKAKNNLAYEQESKQSLLQQTKQSESKYQNLLLQSIQEQEKANRDIQNLEAEVRKRLKSGSNKLDQLNDAKFMWPVNPYKGLSTVFYDPDYIYRRYFEHPGIDIPQPQGTSIKAAEAGYIARAKDAGMGYSYIMIVHKGGLSTVYGHVSRIDVQEETYVAKGQVIGAVGGMPGTRGAGRLTTGPHLHFEVRSNGIPVNPMDYLP